MQSLQETKTFIRKEWGDFGSVIFQKLLNILFHFFHKCQHHHSFHIPKFVRPITKHLLYFSFPGFIWPIVQHSLIYIELSKWWIFQHLLSCDVQLWAICATGRCKMADCCLSLSAETVYVLSHDSVQYFLNLFIWIIFNFLHLKIYLISKRINSFK